MLPIKYINQKKSTTNEKSGTIFFWFLESFVWLNARTSLGQHQIVAPNSISNQTRSHSGSTHTPKERRSRTISIRRFVFFSHFVINSIRFTKTKSIFPRSPHLRFRLFRSIHFYGTLFFVPSIIFVFSLLSLWCSSLGTANFGFCFILFRFIYFFSLRPSHFARALIEHICMKRTDHFVPFFSVELLG